MENPLTPDECFDPSTKPAFDTTALQNQIDQINGTDQIMSMSSEKPIMIDESADAPYPAPTLEQMNDPIFKAIWSVIKHWKIKANWPGDFSFPMGNHVMGIINAIPVAKSDGDGHEYLIPPAEVAEFDRIMEALENQKEWSDEWYDLCDQINDKFGQYRDH